MKKIKGLTFFKIAFYTPLYEKGIKQNQNKPMETTYANYTLEDYSFD